MTSRLHGIAGRLAAPCAGAILLAATYAPAETAPILNINCPSMTEELRSSLEARARAELAVQGVWTGTLQIHCVVPLLVVEYSKPGFMTRSSSTPLPADVNQWVENILGLIHDATTANGASPKAQQSAVQPSSEKPPRAAASSALPQAVPAYSQPASSQLEQPAQSSSTQQSIATDGPSMMRPFAAFGICTDLWPKAGNALLGPCAWTGLRVRRLWRLAATGGVQWAAAQTESIGIRSWHVGLDVRYGRTYWLAIGSELSAIRLAPSSGTLPSDKSILAPVFSLRAGLSKPLVKRMFGVGAGLKLYPEYHDVRVDGHNAFRLPIVALTADVAYEFGP